MLPGATLVPVELDRVRHLRLDCGALADAEEQTGRSYLLQGPMSHRDIRAILWAGLRHEDPKLTMEQVGRMVTNRNVNAVLKAIGQAMRDGMAEEEDEETPQTGAAGEEPTVPQ